MSKEQLLEEILTEEVVAKNHELILYNDDFNTFDYVIETLVRVCKHDELQAEQCAFIVHYNGKCTVKTGAYEKLIPMCVALQNAGLSAEIE
ncbi:ATP-dependent Clp protease adaptor ClpS [Capnocytophaga sp. ARDL2]|uniref:ATP-dependent Clp protease adaptor ClpS n=1 Tax=Capnocytophaga sp. ARDL2 TaxID=3238809 RepID=UPI00355917BB